MTMRILAETSSLVLIEDEDTIIIVEGEIRSTNLVTRTKRVPDPPAGSLPAPEVAAPTVVLPIVPVTPDTIDAPRPAASSLRTPAAPTTITLGDLEGLIIAALERHPGPQKSAFIADQLGYREPGAGRDAITSAFRSLVARGLVHRIGEGHWTRYFTDRSGSPEDIHRVAEERETRRWPKERDGKRSPAPSAVPVRVRRLTIPPNHRLLHLSRTELTDPGRPIPSTVEIAAFSDGHVPEPIDGGIRYAEDDRPGFMTKEEMFELFVGWEGVECREPLTTRELLRRLAIRRATPTAELQALYHRFRDLLRKDAIEGKVVKRDPDEFPHRYRTVKGVWNAKVVDLGAAARGALR
jgi:hypothetical protein